ncbi:MAG TPA: hypothetical protein VK745_09320 [Polyangiaceae bacterium]|nr:hypothetical protein [Polyangiaceae bacterium]
MAPKDERPNGVMRLARAIQDSATRRLGRPLLAAYALLLLAVAVTIGISAAMMWYWPR